MKLETHLADGRQGLPGAVEQDLVPLGEEVQQAAQELRHDGRQVDLGLDAEPGEQHDGREPLPFVRRGVVRLVLLIALVGRLVVGLLGLVGVACSGRRRRWSVDRTPGVFLEQDVDDGPHSDVVRHGEDHGLALVQNLRRDWEFHSL